VGAALFLVTGLSAQFILTPSNPRQQTFTNPQRPKDRLTYVAIGASDTVGIGANDPQSEAWVALVHDRLPAGTRFLRLGVSGSTTRDAMESQLPRAEAAKPDLVTVWLAVNDFNAGVPLQEYRQNLSEILRRMAVTGARTFVANMPDLSGIPRYEEVDPVILRAHVAEWNLVIAEVARSNGAILVDLWPPSQDLKDQPELLSPDDQFHPSTAGHQALADIFLDAISRDTVIGPAVS
jgi:lysophospholipase L1-like esterase